MSARGTHCLKMLFGVNLELNFRGLLIKLIFLSFFLFELVWGGVTVIYDLPLPLNIFILFILFHFASVDFICCWILINLFDFDLIWFVKRRPLIYCRVVVDGIDMTQCCASKGVTGDCLAVCSGDITRFPSNILKCRPYVNSIASCVLPTTTASPTTPGYCLVLLTTFGDGTTW